jgi:hypothetical protein
MYFVDIEPAFYDLVKEVVPFYGEVLRSGTKNFSIIGKGKAGCVVFQNDE